MMSVVLLRILFLVPSVIQSLDNEEREKDALADELMKEFLDVDIDCLNAALSLLLGANPTYRFARSIRLIEAFQFTVRPHTGDDAAHSVQEQYGEVCPANWKGGKTIKPNPKDALKYFAGEAVKRPAETNGANGAEKKAKVAA